MSAVTDEGRVPRRTLPVLKTILEVAVLVVFVLLIWNNFALRVLTLPSGHILSLSSGVAASHIAFQKGVCI